MIVTSALRKAASVRESKDQFTVYLDPATRYKLLRRAIEESAHKGSKVSASQIVERLIEGYLTKKGA